MQIRINTAKFIHFGKTQAVPPPDQYVRLVYCLGYGESELLLGAQEKFRNTGTPFYWDMFGRLAGLGSQPRPEYGVGLERRLKWKIETLRQLYRMGIWLLDASVHAIYLGYKQRLPAEIQSALHQQWWDGYGQYLINSCPGAKIWVVGKTVYNFLRPLPGWHCRGWVYQPHRDAETNWSELLADCPAKFRTVS